MKKYYGKEKCRILKEIRAEIAKQNDIEWVVSECKHQGDCRGTCPRCEYEVRQLEEALARREALGKTVAVVGISAGIALSVSGCAVPFQTAGEPMMPETNRPAGTNAASTESETEPEGVLGGKPVEFVSETESDPEPLQGEILDGVPMPPETESEEDTDLPLPGEEPLEGEPVLPPESDFPFGETVSELDPSEEE